ncbi:UDP-glucoronosyl and UDP-glucosyl transferase [Ancylostoma ceylanicum]|uniref:UDP-glucoronosyl and UDP-glucosyl transferase n=1 Tax=Ancylostoma ceylanicum TaxID=53326 RepID=A0A0D6LQ46_9BILA|nr:UDP-glucoronosyl and UDP-glucosyl transferase [Ancylostoma ceylanicum]
MIRRHQCFCETFSEDHRLRQYLMSQKTDLIVLDHLLQECMGGLASLLNAPIVQYSNWPIADGYVTSMNIPANPSSTPKTATPYSSLGMSFFQRVANVLFHWNIIIARFLQRIWLLETFQRSNLPEVDLIASEAQRIIYAGRSEFLFEVIRPINNRVKHFASNIQLRPSDFVTVIPESCGSETRDGCLCNRISCVLSAEHKLNTSSQLHSTSDYLYSHDFIRHVPEPVKRESLYKNLDRKLVKKRFDTVSMAFPQLHWPSLTNEKFILATFGSLAKAEYIPLDIARKIISAFSRSPYKVIWQTNSPLDSLGWIRNVTIPQNVVLTRWAPVKEMLAHPNLQYLICHGGINTINEVLLFGVPFIGVYLQGDQGSNVRRLADLGAAVMVSVHQISQEELLPIMRKFERNLERMGGAPSKTEPPVVVTSKIPLFCLKKIGPRHILVAGGGGESKTGVLNLMQSYLLTFENKTMPKAPTPMMARLVNTIETDVYATMNMDVVCCSSPEKGRYLIAAGHGQTTGYDVGRDDADKEVLKYKIRSVGRLTTSEKVESFQFSIGKLSESIARNASSRGATEGRREDRRAQYSYGHKCVRFDRSTAGKRVVTGGEDGHIRVWNTRALVEDRNPETIHRPITDIQAHKSDVFDIDISPDGRIIISVGHDGIAKLWDMNLGTLIHEVPFPTECAKGYKVRSIRCTSLGTGSNLVFIAGYNPVSLSSKRVSFLALWVFNRERNAIRTIVVRSTGQGDGIASLCVSSCGNFTGMGSMGGSVFIYDTHEMKQLAAFKETHGIFVTAVEFLDRIAPDVLSLVPQPSPDKPRLAKGPGAIARASIISLSADQTIQVHHLPFEKRSTTSFLIKLFLLSIVLYYLVWCLYAMC